MENDFCRTFSVLRHHFSGGCVERATPVPIPNTEVKPLGADGTARATVWESRKPPGLNRKARERKSRGLFHLTPIASEDVISHSGAFLFTQLEQFFSLSE